MRQTLDNLLDVSPYDSLVEQNRARMAYGITLVLMLLYGLYVLLVPTGVGDRETFLQKMPDQPLVVFYVASFYGIAVLTLLGTRGGQLKIASWGPLLMWICGVYLNTIQTGIVNANNGLVLFGLVILAGLLKEGWGVLWGTLVAVGGLAVGILLRPGLTEEVLPPYITDIDALIDNNVTDFFSLLLLYVGGGCLIYLFLRYARVSRSEGAFQAVEDRQITAEILTQIAQQVARRALLKELLSEIVEQINRRFDFIYHSQIFLVSESGREAQLVASTGEVGQKLLAMGHSLGVGSVSVIGQVTLRGELIIARAGSADTVHRRNEFLLETVVEAAFPLRIGDRIIGALDVQSKKDTAFSDINLLATFQALADSTALAIDNVSQFERAEERLRENERLVAEMREALREVERLNEQLTGRAWSEYLRDTREELSLVSDLETASTTPDGSWTDTLREALRENHLVQKQENGRQVIAMPLRIRGRVVGAMEFELDETHIFSPEDLDLVQEVSDRFGMAVENARLVDQSRRTAQREALVNQINSRLQAANTVEAMLNEAARGIHEALRADQVTIRLGRPPTAPSSATGNGNTR